MNPNFYKRVIVKEKIYVIGGALTFRLLYPAVSMIEKITISK
jgi:hypothetical protein